MMSHRGKRQALSRSDDITPGTLWFSYVVSRHMLTVVSKHSYNDFFYLFRYKRQPLKIAGPIHGSNSKIHFAFVYDFKGNFFLQLQRRGGKGALRRRRRKKKRLPRSNNVHRTPTWKFLQSTIAVSQRHPQRFVTFGIFERWGKTISCICLTCCRVWHYF